MQCAWAARPPVPGRYRGDTGEMRGRYVGDTGEMGRLCPVRAWARDTGEIHGRCRGDTWEIRGRWGACARCGLGLEPERVAQRAWSGVGLPRVRV